MTESDNIRRRNARLNKVLNDRVRGKLDAELGIPQKDNPSLDYLEEYSIEFQKQQNADHRSQLQCMN